MVEGISVTLYAGEATFVTVTAEDFDETPLVAGSVTGMTIQIFDSTGTTVVAQTSMAWDSTHDYWYYEWDTTGRSTGTYRAKCVLTALDGTKSWEWKRIRLARNPF